MFDSYKIVKRFICRGNSKEIVLMKDENTGDLIIRKKYDKRNKAHVKSFHNEVTLMKYLEKVDWQYSPKLLHIDEKNFVFYETYCGKTPPDTPKYRNKAESKTRELFKKHKMTYVRNGKQVWVTYWGNYCLLDDEIYLIDFGSPRWMIKESRNLHESQGKNSKYCKKCKKNH